MRALNTMIHLFKKYAFIFLIAVSFQANAQETISDTKADSLLQVLRLPTLDEILLTTEKAPLSNIWGSVKKNRGKIKNTTLHKLFQKIKKLAVDNKNPGLEMYAGLIQCHIGAKVSYSNSGLNLKLEKIKKKATNSGVLWLEIEAKYRHAHYLINLNGDFIV